MRCSVENVKQRLAAHRPGSYWRQHKFSTNSCYLKWGRVRRRLEYAQKNIKFATLSFLLGLPLKIITATQAKALLRCLSIECCISVDLPKDARKTRVAQGIRCDQINTDL